MNHPLPFFLLLSQGTGSSDSGFDIFLNRSGINSIDLPRGKIQAVTGNNLRVKFVNRGAPIHITISSANGSMYTDFFHENLYVVDESLLDVIHPPLKKPIILEESPVQPVSRGRPHFLMVMLGIALILYTAWLYIGNEFLNIAAFILLIVGALYTWYRQR